MLLTTYVNDLARDALTNGASTMPAGAIIVKENYMPDSTLAAITAMHKVSGYDPAHNDWYWAKWDPDGVAEVAGRVEMCADCYGANASADFLMTAGRRDDEHEAGYAPTGLITREAGELMLLLRTRVGLTFLVPEQSHVLAPLRAV